jgi:PITH domain
MDPPECNGHSHDHEHGEDLGLSLRQYIDLTGVSCLNEEVQGSGLAILKLHEDRLTDTPSLQSTEGDPELLLHIPFTEAVTIQSITIRNASTSTETASPRHIKLFVDRDDLDFETARELRPQQQLELLPPYHFADGTIDYPCRPAGRFQNISSLTIFFTDNYDESGESVTEITHVGLKGKGTNLRRGFVDTVYESQGMPVDHAVREGHGAPSVL